uniref:Uncharacterized protein n=1 Tax=Sphaerodactylus townsendi TaxID=933632 RepID=A0ACB8FKM6_9SAUR
MAGMLPAQEQTLAWGQDMEEVVQDMGRSPERSEHSPGMPIRCPALPSIGREGAPPASASRNPAVSVSASPEQQLRPDCGGCLGSLGRESRSTTCAPEAERRSLAAPGVPSGQSRRSPTAPRGPRCAEGTAARLAELGWAAKVKLSAREGCGEAERGMPRRPQEQRQPRRAPRQGRERRGSPVLLRAARPPDHVQSAL